MMSYCVIGYIDKLIGDPPDTETQHTFPVGTDIIVTRSFIIDDYAQDQMFSIGRSGDSRGKVIKADENGIRIQFAAGTVLTFGDCISDYLDIR